MIPWRRQWQHLPVFLPGEFHGQRSLAGYRPWGCKELDMTDWLTHTQSLWFYGQLGYIESTIWQCHFCRSQEPSIGSRLWFSWKPGLPHMSTWLCSLRFSCLPLLGWSHSQRGLQPAGQAWSLSLQDGWRQRPNTSCLEPSWRRAQSE